MLWVIIKDNRLANFVLNEGMKVWIEDELQFLFRLEQLSLPVKL